MTRRRSGSRGRSRGRQLVKAGLLSLAGAGVAWMVVKTSAVYALLDMDDPRYVYAATKVAPEDPRVAMNIALYDFMSNKGAVSDRARQRAYDALARQPLAETPMLIAAIQALAAGDTARGEALLVEARHRDPRFRAARLFLLDRYLRTNRIAEAGAEIAVLVRLMPEVGEQLVPELARLATNSRTGPNLMRVLNNDPQLQQDVLARLAATQKPDVVLKAAQAVPPRSGPSPAWQGVLLSRLAAEGDFTRAYALWRSFTGAPGEAGEKSVYDGRFQGLRGTAPFNWQLNAGAAGVAERAAGGGLQVQYFGRDPAELASQVLLLAPGRYRLLVQAEGDASGDGARLSWSVSCAQPATRLVELPLRKITSTPQRLAAEFTVPAGCQAQWLRLSGVPAEFPTEQDATFRDVRIERTGA